MKLFGDVIHSAFTFNIEMIKSQRELLFISVWFLVSSFTQHMIEGNLFVIYDTYKNHLPPIYISFRHELFFLNLREASQTL